MYGLVGVICLPRHPSSSSSFVHSPWCAAYPRLSAGAVVLLSFGLPSAWAATARIEPTGTYGIDNLRLESNFLRAIVAPYDGGKVKSLVWKPTRTELVLQTAGGGMFRDIIAAQDHPGELYAASYHGEVAEAGPAAAAVKVWFDGQSRLTRGLRFQRTYVLRDGAPFLEVVYDVSSQSLAKKTLGLRIHTIPALTGEPAPRPFMPLATGHDTAKFNDIRGDLVDGWLATVGPKTRTAVVTVFDYKALYRAFEWEGFTQEWFYRTLTFLPGQSFRTTVRLAYLTDVDDLIGASPRFVLCAKREWNNLTVTVHALEPVDGTLSLEAVSAADHTMTATTPAQEIHLQPGKRASFTLGVPANAPEKTYIRIVVKEGQTMYSAPLNFFGLKEYKLPLPEKQPVAMVQGPTPQLTLDAGDEPIVGEIRGKGSVKVSDVKETLDTMKEGNLKGQRQSEKTVTLSNDKTEFSVHYHFYEGPPKGFVAAGEWSGLGLRGKGALPFYHGGFLDIGFDGKWPMRERRAQLIPRPGMGKGGVDCVWDLPQAKVTLRLLQLAGDERIYCRLKAERKTDYRTMTVRLLVFPGWFTNKHDRWVLTPKRDWQHDDKGAEITADGAWALLYDKVDDPETAGPTSRGPAAVLWSPSEVGNVRVTSDNYSIIPEFTFPGTQREFHFALWAFPQLSWKIASPRLLAEGAKVVALLSKGPALANISRQIMTPEGPRAGEEIRVLQLSTWRNPNGVWPEHEFPELKLYAQPARTTYPGDMGEITFCQRYWFQGIRNFQYFLRGDPEIGVDVAYDDDLLGKLSRLYDYDVLVINDLDLTLLDPFAKDLGKFVERGRGLVFLGGFGAFGGAGADYGTYQGSALEELIPVAITKVPDWDENIEYKEGKPGWGPGYHREWEPDPDDEDRHLWTRQGPALAIEEGWEWLWRNNRVRIADTTHPMVAGVPLDWLSPGYHRVAAKAGATNVAFIGEHPVLATTPVGKGRVIALAFNDYRRFFFWPHTRHLYRQVVKFAAHREPKVSLARPAYDAGTGRVSLTVGNQGQQAATVPVEARVVAPDNRCLYKSKAVITVKAASSSDLDLNWNVSSLGSAPLPGLYRIEARSGNEFATGYAEVPASSSAPQVLIAKDHKRHFTRGEMIQPKLSFSNITLGPGLRWNVELTDSQGLVQRETSDEAAQNPMVLPLPVGRLAFGEYRYVASLVGPDKNVLARKVIPVFVCPNIPIPEYAVGWWGMGLHWFGSNDCYEMLAAISGLREHGNLALLLNSEQSRIAEVCDRALGLGMPLGSYAVACSYHWPEGKYGLSNRHPDKLEFLRQRGDAMAPLAKHPALWFIYTDDEGQGGAIKDYDVPEYRKKHGADPPAKPWEAPVEEQLKLVNFNLQTGTIMWGTAHDAYKKSNPRWLVGMLQSVINRPGNGGGWFWECFNNQDLNLIDLYPCTIGDIDQDFFWLNQMRCVAARNGKPAWVVLGEYRNDFNSLKMQWWLMTGAGLNGYQWFCTNTGMTTGHLDQLRPYDQWAMRYAPLLAHARKPSSRVAILQSKAVWSRLSKDESEDYQRFLKHCSGAVQRVAKELYVQDLYADIITEDHLRDGTAKQYDFVILPGVDVLEKDAVALLTDLAKEKTVVADADTTVAIVGALPFDAAAIRKRVTPFVETPDPLVFAEPLKADDLDCVVVYNHQDRVAEKATVKVYDTGIKKVRDLFHQKDLTFAPAAESTTITLDLDAYDGAFLALLREEPKGLAVKAPASIKAGQDLPVVISIAGPKAAKDVVPIAITVLDPHRAVTKYGRTVVLTGRKLTFVVPTATNDAKGTWSVKAKELLTELAGETAVTVR